MQRSWTVDGTCSELEPITFCILFLVCPFGRKKVFTFVFAEGTNTTEYCHTSTFCSDASRYFYSIIYKPENPIGETFI